MSTTINVSTKLQVWDGFKFAWGVVLFAGTIMVLVGLADTIWPMAYDDSDNAPFRSGLRIKTDHLTGCQYFVTITGSVTPRMNREGKQVCK